MSIFSYTVSLLSLYVFISIAMYPDSSPFYSWSFPYIMLGTVAFLVCPSTAQVVVALIITLIKS